ncbi:MAG: peptidoglycan DD-metalloendopeptidase family protein [Patescibacteria group bacterium]
MSRTLFIRTVLETLALFLCGVLFVFAQSVGDLRDKIDDKRDEIEDIEAEIARYEQELTRVGAERSTLESAIAQLNLTRQKLLSDISLTQKKIQQAQYTIETLGVEIQDKETRIENNNTLLAQALRQVNSTDRQSFVETILSQEDISEVWVEMDQLEQLQATVREELFKLRDLKTELVEKQTDEQAEHDNLSSYKSKLTGQQQVIDENKKQKDTLLNQTKNEEAEYQRLLAEKLAAQKKIESELQDFEAQLQYALDPSRLPKEGSSVLAWPIENPEITQGYGLTSFARQGSYGYDKDGNPNPHRGIDFRASVGTPVLATAPGTVRDAVNMDAVRGCYSYGRWILVDHDNGFSSMYAHLSVMSVEAGDYVKQGQIIGYSGQSGYATGPHLHFTIFDREAVQVAPFTWSNGCKGTRVAYAPYEAYLNPLSYLPK